MRPAIRVPLNTRAGVAQAPTEPGLRCTRWVPCEAFWPEKLWRFMVPAKPLPRLTAVTSTSSPADSRSTASSWPISKPLMSSRRSSTSLDPAATSALAKWPASGLVSLRASLLPKVTCSAL